MSRTEIQSGDLFQLVMGRQTFVGIVFASLCYKLFSCYHLFSGYRLLDTTMPRQISVTFKEMFTGLYQRWSDVPPRYLGFMVPRVDCKSYRLVVCSTHKL